MIAYNFLPTSQEESKLCANSYTSQTTLLAQCARVRSSAYHQGLCLLPYNSHPASCWRRSHLQGYLSRAQATLVFSSRRSTTLTGPVDVCLPALQSERPLSGFSDSCHRAGDCHPPAHTTRRGRANRRALSLSDDTAMLACEHLRFLRRETALDRVDDAPEGGKIRCGSARRDAPPD